MQSEKFLPIPRQRGKPGNLPKLYPPIRDSIEEARLHGVENVEASQWEDTHPEVVGVSNGWKDY